MFKNNLMQFTLQAEEVRRFHEIVGWIIKKPKYLSVHLIVFRGQPALVMHHFDWTLVMPLRGRKPSKPFKIPYRQLQDVPTDAEGNVIVKIYPKKGIGQIHWSEPTGENFAPPFPFGLDGFNALGVPAGPEANEYPISLLDDIWRCAKRCMRPRYPNLSCVHLTPDGELRATDASFALGIQTPFTFDVPEKALVRSCELFAKRQLRKRKTFRMNYDGMSMRFNFGDFLFLTSPNTEHYPNLNKTFPQDDTTKTRLTLDPADAAFLKKHLDDLPGREEHDAPVTLLCDYGGSVSVHGSQAERAKTKAILLVRSQHEGDAYVVQMKRKHLQEALTLGCRDFRFGTSYPLAVTENIRFCWMALDTCGALPLESERPPAPAVIWYSDQVPSAPPSKNRENTRICESLT